ncbi:MAG: hypothetical protein KGI27_09380 [Thaumarchaeota archaeon]|nr:hypothetical protein [Nitrososphaerota archaeon]
MILVSMVFACMLTVTNVSGMDDVKNDISNTPKVDSRVLLAIEKRDTTSDNFYTLVDVILENSSYASLMPKDVDIIYSKNNIIGVTADYSQIIKLATLNFVEQITTPNGVFSKDSNASISNPPSPLEQYKAGIMPIYVKCKYGFGLLIREKFNVSESHLVPACFKGNDESKAQNRGIGKIVNNLVKTKYWDLYGLLPSRKSFLIESNSTGQIVVKYYPYYNNNETRQIKPQVFLDYGTNGSPINTSNVVISAIPDAVSDNLGQNTTVAYTIKTSNIKGLYWLHIPLNGCNDVYPLIVGLDPTSISTADISTYIGTIHCPSIDMGGQIENTSGISVKWLLAEPFFN